MEISGNFLTITVVLCIVFECTSYVVNSGINKKNEAVFNVDNYISEHFAADKIDFPAPINFTASPMTKKIFLTWAEITPEYIPSGYSATYLLVRWGNEEKPEIGNMRLEAVYPDVEVVGLGIYAEYNFTIQTEAKKGEEAIYSETASTIGRTHPDSPGTFESRANVTSTSLSVLWSAPKDKNGPIDGYTLHLFEARIIVFNCSFNNTVFEYKIQNLTAYTDYEVNLYAYNKLGNLEKYSSPVMYKVKTEIDTPSELLNVTATPLSFDKVRLEWLEPAEKNGPLNGYVYSYETHSNETKDRSVDIEHLVVYTEYSFCVMAYNEVGEVRYDGPETCASARTNPAAPSEPLNVTATPLSFDKVRLEWLEPEEKNGPLNGYVYSYETHSNETQDLSVEIEHLVAGTEYSFCVMAYNQVGEARYDGPETCASAFTNPAAPSEPRNVTATPLSFDKVRLKWVEPEVKNGPLNGYVYSYETHSNETKDRLVDVEHLVADTEYTFCVMAYNQVGQVRYDGPEICASTRTKPADNQPEDKSDLLKIILPIVAVVLVLSGLAVFAYVKGFHRKICR